MKNELVPYYFVFMLVLMFIIVPLIIIIKARNAKRNKGDKKMSIGKRKKKSFLKRFFLTAWFFEFREWRRNKDRYDCSTPVIENSLDENYLIDVRGSYIGGRGDTLRAGPGRVMSTNPTRSEDTEGEEPSKHVLMLKAVKPIEILGELKLPVRDIDLIGIDQKIEIFKMKKSLIQQTYASLDVDNVLLRLENRKKYTKYKEFFSQFSTTNADKIAEVLKEYNNLVCKPADIFIPEFPDEVILIMKKYQDICVELCGKKTKFEVIATDDSFRKVNNDRDPIVLAQSPFWMGFDILGAYDKEMLILHKL